jgi:hypothetical protein
MLCQKCNREPTQGDTYTLSLGKRRLVVCENCWTYHYRSWRTFPRYTHQQTPNEPPKARIVYG